jgi:hypothetical protein
MHTTKLLLILSAIGDKKCFIIVLGCHGNTFLLKEHDIGLNRTIVYGISFGVKLVSLCLIENKGYSNNNFGLPGYGNVLSRHEEINFGAQSKHVENSCLNYGFTLFLC